MQPIELKGARTNNLRAVDLTLEPGSLLVVCGPSGAGKSSLAFGTLYAEGQRRYVESFSAYARQFLERLARPPLDALRFMPAAIAVDRGGQVKTSRSTVATLTELADCLKQLWALCAELDCPECGAKVRMHSPASAAATLTAELPERRVVITYPRRVESEEEYLTLRETLVADGYRRLFLGGEVRDVDQVRPSEAVRGGAAAQQNGGAAVYVVADRTTTRAGDAARLRQALEVAFERGAGHARVFTPEGEQRSVSRELRCDGCGRGFRKPSPGLFSFNSPIGACSECRGFGRVIGIDWEKVFAREKSIAKGAVKPWAGKAAAHERKLLLRYCARAGIATDRPLRELDPKVVTALIEGDGGGWRSGYPGLARWFAWLQTRAYKMHVRVLLSRYRSYDPCPTCKGERFKPEVGAFKVDGKSLPELYAMEASAARAFIEAQQRRAGDNPALARALDECRERLITLCDVGLGYLTLDRSARSLSGGELQRVTLTSALDSRLTGTLFVLDEPSIGLHPADVARLVPVVRRLTQGDNVAVVVESDERFIASADRVIELGPGAGEEGGAIVFDGAPARLPHVPTATGRWLASGGARIAAQRRAPNGELVLRGARGNNLQGVELRVPLGCMTCVTGVSGSGKSSLIVETLVPAVLRAQDRESPEPLPFDALSGHLGLTSALVVDQAPLGRTSRGNPATYLGVWDALRKHFAATPLAIERGYKPGMFSFNVAGGRCEACKGEGAETVEMQFLSDVRLTCPSCAGRRFVGPVLDVQLEGKSVADVLQMTAAAAHAHFARYRDVARALEPLLEVGSGYLRLGQPLSTLSGGEAQRLKLAEALASAKDGSLIVLDEPTAGLHGADVLPLLACFDRLVAAGNTLILIEHDMRVAAHADHVIELGPGAGADGGRIVAAGSPEALAASKDAASAEYIRGALSPLASSLGVPHGALAVKPSSSADAHANSVRVRGAREHNLKHIDVDIPRERFVVVTGPSGSGKSTLAFDVVFAESQRRYLETLSPYVRQYLKQLPRPQVDEVAGMPPGVSLEQKRASAARNSTVATVTEVAHYLRLLYARAGLLHCPECRVPIAPRPLDSLCADIAAHFGKRAEVELFASAVRAQKGSHKELLARAAAGGIRRARIDGALYDLGDEGARGRGRKSGLPALDRYREHDIELLLGSARAGSLELRDTLERALRDGRGTARAVCGAGELLLSSARACASCGQGYPEPDPRFFSFNTRQGACPRCEGSGEIEQTRRNGEVESAVCPACEGKRLAGLALHTTIGGATLPDLLALSVSDAVARIESITLTGRDEELGRVPLREASARLRFLERVGLAYLGLGRAASSLSGGELQRVRLAAQLGSGLTGVLYVLDEPTIGLHPRDTGRLLSALRELCDQGCSVLVVEHDADTIRAADHVIDVGPRGGQGGGHIVAQGSPAALLADPASVTGRALARPAEAAPKRRPVRDAGQLELRGARQHNLKNIDLRVPAARFVAVTGVSGSGKSTLVRDVLLNALRAELGLAGERPGAHAKLLGASAFKRAVEVDQSPIGRTPRSVPATYVGVWDEIRKLYAATPDARARGYTAARFSFNVGQGRCAECEGQGVESVEMSFLPEALVPCEACNGLRYNSETLAVNLHGVNIGQLLGMHIDEVTPLLSAFPAVRGPLQLMSDLGLGYLTLGQPSNSLSGGEAQRMKLVSELAQGGSGPTLYVMDEPTTGLHRDDVRRLLQLLDRLVDRGDTVLCIEHHPDLILHADWVIDLGPEGGDAGGCIVAEGTPEQIMRAKKSHTGAALRRALDDDARPAPDPQTTQLLARAPAS